MANVPRKWQDGFNQHFKPISSTNQVKKGFAQQKQSPAIQKYSIQIELVSTHWEIFEMNIPKWIYRNFAWENQMNPKATKDLKLIEKNQRTVWQMMILTQTTQH